MNRKALPDNIEDFFKGAPVFFQEPEASALSTPPPSIVSPTKSSRSPKTERPNDRTVERANGATERSNDQTDERLSKRTNTYMNGATERKKESSMRPLVQSSQPTVEPHSPVLTSSVDDNYEGVSTNGDSILERLMLGKSDTQEHAERYSFEIYPSQKEQMEDFLYEYKKKTGEKLSASKLIREALTYYFQAIKDAKIR